MDKPVTDGILEHNRLQSTASQTTAARDLMMDIHCSREVIALAGKATREVSKKRHRYFPATGDKLSWTFEQQINAIAPRRAGGFIVTLRQHFSLWNAASNPLEDLQKAEPNTR